MGLAGAASAGDGKIATVPSSRLTVAVCTNRKPAQISATLAELERQLRDVHEVEGLLVASGLGAAGAEELRDVAARHGMRCIEAPTPGLSIARNAALEAAGDADVIAYLDDDAIPAPGWLANLAAHWAEAPPDIACIGGAIDPLFSVPPPEWMSERVHVVFSLLDRGPGIVALEAGREDAWGANVSFRVDALRVVGGFDPALGPVAGIPFFADETEAQRRLAAAGHRGIYAGDVRVGHVVGPERMRLREVLRRRFYAGAGMGRIGQWGIGAGVARLAGGTAGAAAALLRRRPTDLAVAIGRIGAGAGVLAEPLVRRRLARLQAR